MRAWINSVKEFLLRNLGLIIVISGNLVPLVLFILGIVLESDTWSPDSLGISNRTLIWVISIPFFTLVMTFLGQLIFYRMDTHREIKELKSVYETRLNEVRNYSELFSVIDKVNNKDIYASTIYSFILEKLKNDIKSIENRNFIAEGWYWKLSNKFILHEKSAMCTCILSPLQLNEPDIHEYFQEQYVAISHPSKNFQLERILIVETLIDLKGYSAFVSEQLNHGVKIFVISREFTELSQLGDEDWKQDFKRDFALIDDNYLIEGKIINSDLKGYEIKALNGVVPTFAHSIRKHRKPVEAVVDSFANGSYNPVKEILSSKSK